MDTKTCFYFRNDVLFGGGGVQGVLFNSVIA